MAEVAQLAPVRRLEVLSGALALVAGLLAIGVQLFAPLVTVQGKGPEGYFIRHQSNWETFSGFIFLPLGLAALGICLLCVLAIGYGAYAHGVRHAARGRLLLWWSTALLALGITLSLTVFGQLPGNLRGLFPLALVVPYLLPSVVLAALASGAAAT